MHGSNRVSCIVLYRESLTWQGLAVTSRLSTSSPVVGSYFWFNISVLEGIVYLYTVSVCAVSV